MRQKPETLDMKRTSKPAPDHDIEAGANSIIDILKDFKSPKDAGSAFTLAHYRMIIASFPPAFRKEAVEALDAHTNLIKEFLSEGWQ
jgi:hypothetical protein